MFRAILLSFISLFAIAQSTPWIPANAQKIGMQLSSAPATNSRQGQLYTELDGTLHFVSPAGVNLAIGPTGGNISTLGTITAGVWHGTAIADTYISSASVWNGKQSAYANLTSIGGLADSTGWLHNNGSGTFAYSTPSKSDVGLSSVENTALSTWAGTSNLTTLGTITSGTWHGNAVDGAYTSIAGYQITDSVSVFRYFSAAERASVTARNLAVDVTAALQAAIDANYGKTIFLEPGYYKITGLTITDAISIIGCSSDFTRGGAIWGCALVNQSTTSPAITIASGVYHHGVLLRAFGIIGNGSGTGTPNGNTDDGIYFSGEGQHLFERLQITNCGGYGIRSTGVVDKALIKNCRIAKSSTAGVRLVNTAATGGHINALAVEDCEIDTNYGDGLQMWGSFVNVRRNIIQGNSGYGVNISTSDTTTPQIVMGMSICDTYFENNVLGNIYGTTTSIARTAMVWNLLIGGNQFSNTNNVPDIKLTGTDGTAAYHPWRGCRIMPNMHKIASPTNVWVDFDNKHGYTTTVVLPNMIGETFSNRYTGLSTSATNAIGFIAQEGRWTNGPDQKSSDYVGQISYDNVNAVHMRAVTSGSGYADWKAMERYIGSAAPTKGCFRRGEVFWNSAAASGATPYWIQTTASGSGSYGTTRADSAPYTTSSPWITWSTGTTVWECTTAGTSAGSAPSISGKVVGDTVVDGTVTWTCRSLTQATWTAAANLP